MMNIESRKATYKEALCDVLHDQGYTNYITLSWNRSVGYQRARADLKDLLNRIDRRLLGRRFHKKPPDQRTNAIFFFEGASFDHMHVHSLWRFPPGRLLEFHKLWPNLRGGIWNEVVPSGSHKIELLSYGVRQDVVLGYVTKEQHPSSECQTMVTAADFHAA